MHHFCCITSMSIHTNSDLPPPPPPLPPSGDPVIGRSLSAVVSRALSSRDSLLDHGFSFNSNVFSRSLSQNHTSRDLKINDIVGNGISGILHKWVNYGKGWRPRWFVLQDGVLSYYKINGPDRINPQTEKGSRVIGEESMKRLSRKFTGHRRTGSWGSMKGRKPVGEVHLKVSTIRASRSDDRRFSIFTGTKRLHLRADSAEDRVAWLEALEAVKDMFPRMSTSEVMAPIETLTVSTEGLRQKLLEEGLSESAIEESEQIMRSEFASLQNQFRLLSQKYWLLTDTLRQLETEKVDLENTVVDESQRQFKDVEASARAKDKYSGSATESEDENERVDVVDEDTDEEENTFFDTRDFLSSSSFKSNGSDLRSSSFSSDDDDEFNEAEDNTEPGIKSAGTNIAHVKRRKKLPDPVEKEKGVSLWSMIKDNIGKDLTKVCLPVYFNEPLSSLQKCFEDMEYSYLLDRANEWGEKGNSLMRILNVAAFAVSGYASTEGRICKPFNPLLGETYEADYPEKGLRFFSEKVSHHPMVVACHCEGTGWRFYGDSNLRSKFWGRSIQLDPEGTLTLEFDDGEVFQWSKVTTSIYNLILGKLYCDHYGTMRIQGNRGYSCKLKFKEQSLMDRNPHQVQGLVQDKSGKTAATLIGKWDTSMHYVNGEFKGKGHNSSEAHLLWRRSKPPEFPTRYNLTRFAITLNELVPGLEEKLPPTDSRLRPDQRCLENGEYEKANAEKLRLEQRQRQARKMQEQGWKPRWFAKESNSYRYIGGYWEAREQSNWEGCPDIFGQVPPDQIPNE
ncbi:oxysterol-binding protein-related protein 1C-like isoform X1 [Salvia hispanica]|uniref:oxysterol-binding protein-related protein 1C-like isoform X1 n=2 Tax=Salvia hispanica TaxID=49212 RepID=UPI002008FD02|nr:oxysterol-binding protein-related protein 1C-like isoform X1 [Salvia hispanica]